MEPFNPKPKKKKPLRETGRGGVEDTGRKHVRAKGGDSYKWVSPGCVGVPDQIELYGADAMVTWLSGNWHALEAAYFNSDEGLRAMCVLLLAEALQLTEYKRPGAAPTSHQLRMHERLRARGFTVNVIDHKRKDES